MKNPGIVIDDVSFGYNRLDNQLKNIKTIIPKGSFCGITGTNGSGKTTFSYLLNGLIPHQVVGNFSGNVFVDGINTREKPVTYFSKKVGMVFQNPDFMIFNLTVKEEIAFGLMNFGIKNIDEKVSISLETVGLKGFENRDPHSLSFGQKQKLCLATVLAMDSDYIVLDEPSAMLDYKSSVNLYEILKRLNKKGKTIIIIEHDTDFLFSFANQIIIFDKGSIVMSDTVNKVFKQKKLLKNLGIKIPNCI